MKLNKKLAPQSTKKSDDQSFLFISSKRRSPAKFLVLMEQKFLYSIREFIVSHFARKYKPTINAAQS